MGCSAGSLCAASAAPQERIEAGERRKPKRARRFLSYLLPVAVFAGLVVAGVKYIDSALFWRAIHRFHWIYLLPILLLATAYLLTKGWRFVTQMRELTDANGGTILKGYVAGQACTLLPGGMAARAGLLEQIGIPVADSAASIALSSMLDQAVLIFCSLLSALWFETARKPAMFFLGGLMVVSVLLGIEATRTWLLGVIEKLMGKVKLLDHWREFLDSMKQMTSWSILMGGLGNTVLAFAMMVVALDLAARGIGAAIPYPTLLLAFTLPTMLGRISAMPGGVGVTEAGMVGILDATPNVTLDQAAAAVFIFRLGTVVFTALLGGAVYFLAWRGRKEATR